jgi:hypothetical protein
MLRYGLQLCSILTWNPDPNTDILSVYLLWFVLCSNRQLSLTRNSTKCVTAAESCLLFITHMTAEDSFERFVY